VPPAWVPAAIVAEGRKARENLRGESSWEFFASGGPYILGINTVSIELKRLGSVVTVVMRGTLSIDDATALIELMKSTYAEQVAFALIVDARGVSVPTADVRRRLSENPRKAEELADDRGRHVAVVLNSGLVRGALTALMWFMPKNVAIHPVKTAAEALVHLQSVGHPNVPNDAATVQAFARQTDAAWLISGSNEPPTRS